MGVNVVTSHDLDDECDAREYPWVGVLNGTVVGFSANGVGTVLVADDDDFEQFEHSTDWDMDMFEPYDGFVVLANDGVDLPDFGCDE